MDHWGWWLQFWFVQTVKLLNQKLLMGPLLDIIDNINKEKRPQLIQSVKMHFCMY